MGPFAFMRSLALISSCSTRYPTGARRFALWPPMMYCQTFASPLCLLLQKHVDSLQDDKVKKLWRRTGAGGPKGIGPYKVGVRFFPTDRDGKLIDPFVFTF